MSKFLPRWIRHGKDSWGSQERNLLDRKTYGYRDNFANLTAAATGAGTPSLQAFGPSGNIKQRRFSIGDSVYVVWHINHDVVPDSTCFLHMHWTTDAVGTQREQPVHWEINYTYAKGHSQGDAFPADTTVTLIDTPTTTAWEHRVIEDTTGFTIPEVDSLVVAEIKRVTNGATENNSQVFGLFADIHYLSDRNTTVSRAPDFYQGPVVN